MSSALRIIFEPFNEEAEIDFDDEGAGDVAARLTLYFGDPQDDGPLRLAGQLIDSYLNGEGAFIEVPGLLEVHHRDRELPPTAFLPDTAPEWFRRLVDTYRKDGGPDLLKELTRLEKAESATGSAKRSLESALEDLSEKLGAAVDALRDYARGNALDGARARHVLTFIGQYDD